MPSRDELSTLLQHRVDTTPASNAVFVLTVIEGPDTGKSLRLDPSTPTRAYVGSSPSSELTLSDREVSRRHLALEMVGSRLRVTDQGSKNGTFVDGTAMVEVFLAGDETLRLGGSAIRVTRTETGEAPELPYVASCGDLVGMSREMRRLYPLIERLAGSDVPVLIEGETGTGKEVAARTIHQLSRRREGAFVVFDCAASPAGLIEGELFGHEKSGGAGLRKGVFEQADGGTLFIDEIGDLDLALQPKLLRAIENLEEHRVRRIGSRDSRDRVLKFDVRIVASSRRDLDREVQEGRFRDDLYHRLVVGRFELPPLRTRRGDVSLLSRRFVQELGADPAKLTAGVLSRWESSRWPGNVRELKNAVARHLALGELDFADPNIPDDEVALITPAGEAAADPFDDVIAEGLPLIESRQKMIEAFERRYLTASLGRTGGNVTHAARLAGIPRRYFQALRAKRFKPG